jgi:photosystem II stability/assembly factor-like uncharacterized protein
MPMFVDELVFIDEKHGWVLGSSPLAELWENPGWEFSMASSSDGGISWQAVPMPLQLSWGTEIVGDIFFADTETGWFFYFTYSFSDSGLYSTRDGGQTWREERPSGSVYRIDKAVDGTIWAFEIDDCQCAWRVYNVPEASYESWHEVALNIPEELTWPGDMVVIDDMNMMASQWNFVSEEHGEFYYYSILSTHDGGANWTELSTSCGSYVPSTTFFANHVAIDRDQVWLGCGAAAGAGSGSKYVYYSSDGGTTWEQLGKYGPPFEEEDSLDRSGYFSEIHALSPSFAYMTWKRLPYVVLTQDGGVTWEYAELPCSSETLHARFLDPQHGWAFSRTWDFAHTCINRTIDGGETWQCTLLPENSACPLE